MNFAWRIYRRLAQAFPHEFKLAYGPEVMQLGEDVVEEIAKRHGAAGLIRLIADIAIRVPLEYLSEMRGDMRYAWRALTKSPGFALVGIISMGLGIGLTTNVCSSKWAMWSRDVARWVRFGLSVAGPFVRRCLTIQTMLRFHIPLIGRVEG